VGSVIFDFDSTLVPVESLEVVLSTGTDLSPVDLGALHEATTAGMEGRISFEESLERRLAIAEPTRAGVEAVARSLARSPSAGVGSLVDDLRTRGHEVRIVSGGLVEILRAFGAAIGIPPDHIHGVSCRWAPDGSLLGLETADGFARSKVEGLRRLDLALPRPAIGVGDGATDLALRDAGLVDAFIAYTEFARREVVVAGADEETESMAALGVLLGKLLP